MAKLREVPVYFASHPLRWRLSLERSFFELPPDLHLSRLLIHILATEETPSYIASQGANSRVARTFVDQVFLTCRDSNRTLAIRVWCQ